MDLEDWLAYVLGTLAVAVVVAMLVALVWTVQARSVGSDRRLHSEHMAEISVCRTAPNPADCFRRLALP